MSRSFASRELPVANCRVWFLFPPMYMPSLGSLGRCWQVRERVWQSLKDVKAMEQHVREQNQLNLKLKGQVEKLTGEAAEEKAEIRRLIDSGINDVTNRILVLKHVAMGNVTAVKELLEKIEREQESKQNEQDEALDLLEKRQQELVSLTKSKFDSESKTIASAQEALLAAEDKVAKERKDVKTLIMQKIEGEVDGLGDNMKKQLNNEKAAIQAKVDGRAKGLEDRIMDYSHTTGLKVSGLVNQVNNLEKQQKEQIATQEVKVAAVKEDQLSLKQQTMADLSALRSQVERTRAKLSEAEDTLQAEQTVHATAASSKNS